MRKIVIYLLCFALALSGCSSINKKDEVINNNQNVSFFRLDDPELLCYVEDELYKNVIRNLDSENYFVENIETIYISKEYLEEMEFNTQSNIYFGYSLEQIDEAFGNTKYIFDIDENGNTTVRELVEITDDFNHIIENLIVGSGVILICVTVSIVSAPALPSVSMIFAASAKSATMLAVSGAALDGIVAAAITGYETGDFDQATQSGLIAASEGFKWGAIFGAVNGGVGQAKVLKGATLNGLTMNEAAKIQKDSKLPLDFIKSFHSVKEYEIYKKSSLKMMEINGKNALVQPIDWDFIGDIEDGRTNMERVLCGLAPLDSSGKSYELHHIGQKNDSPLAILTSEQHKKNYADLHFNTGSSASDINRNAFAKEKREFWKNYLETTQGVGG